MFALLLALAAAPASPNVLLVTIDTLRADRLGGYGHARAATPVLDRLAREGVLVEEAVVQVPQTRPSHASILTGRQPYEHGHTRQQLASARGAPATLATVLRGHGYATGAVVGAYPVSRPSGLHRGFDFFDDPFGAGETRHRPRPRGPSGARAEVVDAALGWLARPRTAPFFLWLHVFDPHAPYDPPAPFRERFAGQPYDGEVAYVDAQLGRVFARFARDGRAGPHAGRGDLRPRRGPGRPRRRRAPAVRLRLHAPRPACCCACPASCRPARACAGSSAAWT